MKSVLLIFVTAIMISACTTPKQGCPSIHQHKTHKTKKHY
jgi:hypothetical protein